MATASSTKIPRTNSINTKHIDDVDKTIVDDKNPLSSTPQPQSDDNNAAPKVADNKDLPITFEKIIKGELIDDLYKTITDAQNFLSSRSQPPNHKNTPAAHVADHKESGESITNDDGGSSQNDDKTIPAAKKSVSSTSQPPNHKNTSVPNVAEPKEPGESIKCYSPVQDCFSLRGGVFDNGSRSQTGNTTEKENLSLPLNGKLEKLRNDFKYIYDSLAYLRKYEDHVVVPFETVSLCVAEIVGQIKSESLESLVKGKILDKNFSKLDKMLMDMKIHIPSSNKIYTSAANEEARRAVLANKKKKLDPKSNELEELPVLHSNQNFLHNRAYLDIKEVYDSLGDFRCKLCLLCFSVFPKDVIVKKRILIYWWIGEGLLLDIKKADEDADKILIELVNKGFIEPVDQKYREVANSFWMHPLIRSAVMAISKEVKFFDFDNKGKPTTNFELSRRACLVGAGASFELTRTILKDKKDDQSNKSSKGEGKSPAKGEESSNNSSKGEGKSMAKIEESSNNSSKGEGKSLAKDEESSNNSIKRKEKIPAKQGGSSNKSSKSEGKSLAKGEESSNNSSKGEGKSLAKIEESSNNSSKSEENGPAKKEVKSYVQEKLITLYNVEEQYLKLEAEWFLKLKNVQVLQLGRWINSAKNHIEVEDVEFLQKLQNMKNLLYFSLQGISRISELPDTIGNLTNLKILDLRACHSLEILPKNICSLQDLVHLDMSECHLLEKVPKEISSLSNLEVLKGFVIGESHGGGKSCTLNDLKNLKALRKLSIRTGSKDFPKPDDVKAIQKFTTLSNLKIIWGGNSLKKPKIDDKPKKDGHKAPPPSRKFSKGTNVPRGGTPPPITLPGELTKLDLQCFPHRERPSWLDPSHLGKLKKLYIRGGRLSDLLDKGYEWKSVETLCLKHLYELTMDWTERQKHFPELKYLEVVRCPKLAFFPCNEKGVWIKR